MDSRRNSVFPSPPSIGSIQSSINNKKLHPPPPPSIGTGSITSGSSGVGSKRGSSDTTSQQSRSSKRSRSTFRPDRESSDDEAAMTPANREKLIKEQRKIVWIRCTRNDWNLTYDNLLLGRKVDVMDREDYVYTTYCQSNLLQQIMDLKYKIKGVNSEKFFELRTKMNSFDGMDEILFRNPDAIRMANIDALMGYALSNPRNSRGETLLLPNELLYFVDIYGAPGGAAEYFLWKKQWYAHGFGFTSRKHEYDLPVKEHYSAESFEAVYGFYGGKGEGDIYDPEEVEFFMKYVWRNTNFTGAHFCIAQGGDLAEGDEDRKELRSKFMLMSEFMIALHTLREGGHFVLKVYDMFTSFTVGLVYLMYRVFESVAIFKPETCLPASSERFILCKFRKGNKFIGEVKRYLMDNLTTHRNCQRLYKGANQDIADIPDLVPYEVIRSAHHFYDHVLNANDALGKLQIQQTNDILRNMRVGYSFLKNRQEEIRKKATALWGIPEKFQTTIKYAETESSSSVELRAAKLVRPYPPDILMQMDRDGEQVLSFSNADELVNPREWHFVPVGRDRGFFLSLGGKKVYRYSGSGSQWEATDDMELSNNTLIYGDIIEEIIIYENRQVIRSGLNIIDAVILGGKDIRNLPYLERNELCQKFARSMNKQNRDDIVAVRCKKPRELTSLGKCLLQLKNETLKGGGKGPSKQIIYPIEEQEQPLRAFRKPRAPLVFHPQGFSIFKTGKGGGVEGDFLYSLNNRLYWRFNEDVNLDPNFDGWKTDAEEKYGPMHAATLLHYIKRASGASSASSSSKKSSSY